MHRLALLLFTMCAGVLAQGEGQLRGTVVDAQSGEPLARVRIQLLASTYVTISDGQGRFALDAVQAGGYTVQASTVGYRVAKKEFRLADGETKEFEIVLSADTFRQTDTVEVRAEPFEPLRADTVSEVTLAGNELKNLASVLADDPLRAVQALPGVASNDDLNATFSLRGAAYEHVGLYFDDVLLHQPFHTVEDNTASGSLTVFNGDLVQDVSLMPGAFPARYGDRTAAALDVRTREGSRKESSVRASASMSNAALLAEGPVGGRGSWLVSARQSYLQYLIERTSNGNEPSLAAGFRDVEGRASYDLGAKHNLSLTAIEGRTGFDREEVRDRLGVNAILDGRYHFTLATLAWTWTARDRLLVTSRAAWSREKYDNTNRDQLDLSSGRYGEWVWNENTSWIWGARNAVDTGFSIRRVRDSGFSNYYQFHPFAARRLDDYGGNATICGAFAQQSFQFLEGRLRLTAGGRWDRYSATTSAAVSPRASLAFQLGSSTRLQFGWGQYAQFPTIQALYSRAGNGRLIPERSLHAIASLEQKLDERSRVRIEFYQRLDRDVIERPFAEPRIYAGQVYNPPIDTPAFNSARGYARGMELLYQSRTANRFSGWISYALSYARLRDSLTGATFWADEDQRHTINIYGSYRVRPTINLSTKWIYGSGFPVPGFFRQPADRMYFLAAERNQVRLHRYQRTDVRMNKAWVRPRAKITLYGEVVNLFNHTNRRFDAFNGYNSRTGQAWPGFSTMFPIMPSVGVVAEF